MRRLALGATVLCGLIGRASADVRFSDPYFAVGVQYAYAPVHLPGEREPVIGTSIHVTDRNGLYGKLIADAIVQPPSTRFTESDTNVETSYDEFGNEWETTYFRYKPEYDTVAERDAANLRDASWRLGNHFHTDVQVFVPQQDRSNARGASAGVSTSVFGSTRTELEIGFRWSSIKADVCGTEPAPVRCVYRFIGLPVRLQWALGRIGYAELGWDLNLLALGDGAGVNESRASVERARDDYLLRGQYDMASLTVGIGRGVP